MGELFPILLFATIAVLFALRLYMVLGRRTGEEPKADVAPRAPGGRHGATGLRPAFTGPAAAGMEAIRAADGVFDPDAFLSGAREAYALVGRAFAEGDRRTLEQLLSPNVYEKWTNAIAEREAAGHEQVFELVRLASAEVEEAALTDGVASVSVRFSADIRSALRDREGVAIEGDADHAKRVDEVWAFERQVASDNPNWRLSKVSKG